MTAFLTSPFHIRRHHFSPRACVTSPVSSNPFRLPALPFPPPQVFLPGQTKQLHLYEARYLALFEECLKSHDKQLAHVLFDSGRSALAAYGTLGCITRWRRMDVGVGVEIRGIGRVRTIELAELEPYWSAVVEIVTDNDNVIGEGEEEKGVREKVLEVVQMCVKLGEEPICLRDDVKVFNDQAAQGVDECMQLLEEEAKKVGWGWVTWQLIESNILERQRALESKNSQERVGIALRKLEERARKLAAKVALRGAFAD